jgi:hypothetical protein
MFEKINTDKMGQAKGDGLTMPKIVVRQVIKIFA